MKKVMLTVFKHNHGAYQFFREALQWVSCLRKAQTWASGCSSYISSLSAQSRFEIDETSPSMSGCCGDDCSYEILSRRTKHGEASAGHTHGGGHCGGCCHWSPVLPISKPATFAAVRESSSCCCCAAVGGGIFWVLDQDATWSVFFEARTEAVRVSFHSQLLSFFFVTLQCPHPLFAFLPQLMTIFCTPRRYFLH